MNSGLLLPICVFTAVALANPVYSSELAEPDVVGLVKEARIIARVSISDRHQWVFMNEAGHEVSCGYVYDANVVEEIKGQGARRISFLGGDQLGTWQGKEFLVLLFARDSAALQAILLRNGRPTDEMRYQLCEGLAAELKLIVGPNTFSRFEKPCRQVGGGDWLLQESFGWLRSERYPDKRMWQDCGGPGKVFLPWETVVADIKQILARP